jgi:hypothetical protein
MSIDQTTRTRRLPSAIRPLLDRRRSLLPPLPSLEN